MRFLTVCFILCMASVAQADTRTRTVTVTRSAQDDAEYMARHNTLRHRGGQGYEGIGFSTVSEDHATRNCCYWGQRRVKAIGVCRGAQGWFACVRYW